MRASSRLRVMLVACAAGLAVTAGAAMMQEDVLDPARNSLPNPIKEVVTGWGSLPDGRTWGMSAGIDIGPDGNIWAYDRCGANTCAESKVDPIRDSWRKSWPCSISPRACRTARRADVPVPQGDRSTRPGETITALRERSIGWPCSSVPLPRSSR